MTKTLLIAAVVAATAVGGIAAAETIGRHDPMAADSNRDGVISRSEYLAAADARFKKHDANGDRQLTSGEYPDRMRGQDTNHDGVISYTEANAAALARFNAKDADQNGSLSADEVRRGGGRGMRHGPGGPDGMAAKMMGAADADHDGRISRDEMRAEADKRFARLDANHDGFIDKTELAAMRGRGRGGHGGGDGGPHRDHAGE